MKTNPARVASLLVVGLLMAAGIHFYYRSMAQSEARHRQMNLDLEQVNRGTRAMINAGPSEAKLKSDREKLITDLRAQDQKRQAESKRQVYALHVSNTIAAQAEAREREKELNQIAQEVTQSLGK